jgi:multidrug efflux pump subunit AcrA (membrane-fusion protein)
MATLRKGLPVLIVAALALAGWQALRAFREAAAPAPAAATVAAGPSTITALGRLEPRDGAIRIAGPSRPSVVVGRLLVDENDVVKVGQELAILDTHATSQAEVQRRRAELANIEAELHRHGPLVRDGVVSKSLYEEWRTKVEMASASLRQAEAELELDVVRSPVDGQVLEVYARQGERVGDEGILEVGRTHEMFAVAEVYETDVQRVKLGQRAAVRSPALPSELAGTVAKIHAKIGKQDVLATDPAARTDSRVVEVEIRLDESDRAAALTNLEVDVEITP